MIEFLLNTSTGLWILKGFFLGMALVALKCFYDLLEVENIYYEKSKKNG